MSANASWQLVDQICRRSDYWQRRALFAEGKIPCPICAVAGCDHPEAKRAEPIDSPPTP